MAKVRQAVQTRNVLVTALCCMLHRNGICLCHGYEFMQRYYNDILYYIIIIQFTIYFDVQANAYALNVYVHTFVCQFMKCLHEKRFV